MERFRVWLRKIIVGRSGPDELTRFCSAAGWVLLMASLLLPGTVLRTVLGTVGAAAAGLSLFRMFSRNVYKRSAENRYYLQRRDAVKQKLHQWKLRWVQRKDYRFFRCESCRTLARVPRGRGKICITCPHCRHEFIRKS